VQGSALTSLTAPWRVSKWDYSHRTWGVQRADPDFV